MSWLDDVGDSISGAASSVWSSATSSVVGMFTGAKTGGSGSNLLGGLLSTALTGFALNKISNSISNSTPAATTTPPPPDTGVNIQIAPNTQQKIPVFYGTSTISGIITDAVMSADALTMYYVLTLSERTGIKISDNLASAVSFTDIYWNGQRVVFQSDGITAQYTVDDSSNEDPNIAGLVQVFCYSGSSTCPVIPHGYNNVSLVPAYNIVPGWTTASIMSDLVFAIVKVTYNKSKGITGLPTISFKLNNSMKLPGDCMFDYMTSVRYGAAITQQDIYTE